MAVTLVVGVSITMQLLAGLLALRLMRTTTGRLPWALVTAGLWGMAGRRGLSLAAAFSGHPLPRFELPFELVGLLTSGCMLAGIFWIGPLFERNRAAREEAQRRARELEALAAGLREALDNARVLRGLLPICASCKKIRDDRGYWHQVEAYIHARTDADFSHGICPECADRMYPGYGKHRGAASP